MNKRSALVLLISLIMAFLACEVVADQKGLGRPPTRPASGGIANTEPTDQELHAEYDAQVAKLPSLEYHARHILVSSESTAQSIVRQLENGQAFDELAQRNSLDSSKDRGGDLGWFTLDYMVKPFSDGIVGLKPGEFTHKPVKTQYGWHIVELLETRKLDAPPFEQVRDRLGDLLRARKAQATANTSSLAARGGTDTKIRQPHASGTSILIDTDDGCRLTVDNEDEGPVTPDHAARIPVAPGSHIVKCVSDGSRDLIWRKIIEAKRGEQATALIALRALHSQLDQAVTQKDEAAREEARKEQESQQLSVRKAADLERCQSSCTSNKQSCLDTIESNAEVCRKRIPGMGGTLDALSAGLAECSVDLNQCRSVSNPGLCMQQLNTQRQQCLANAQNNRSAALQECSDRGEAAERGCGNQFQGCLGNCGGP